MTRVLGLTLPTTPVISGHDAPFDYLVQAFFEPDEVPPGVKLSPGRDLLVWAARGSGKTMLGAAATLLDMLFKPGIEVRMLAGSLEQAQRMYHALGVLLERPGMRPMLADEPTLRRTTMIHGSTVEVLAQSQRSVRGVHVHKLRCDEVDELDPEVWRAAQHTTRSGRCGPVLVRGRVEAFSTMHRPTGLMSELARRAAHRGSMRMFRWSALDVIERCPAERPCATCLLEPDCQGLAKQADGFVSVDDLVTQRRRATRATWQAEMLCERPSTASSVYPQFDHATHVRDQPLPTRGDTVVAGMDFGWRSPLVMLWAVRRGDTLHVFDEHVRRGQVLAWHLRRIRERPWPLPRWISVDPAGEARNSHTGLADVDLLREAGFAVRSVRLPTRVGIDRVRAMLEHGRLTISPRCGKLIDAMVSYHYDAKRPLDEQPVKDGPDHLCDALRYMVIAADMAPGRQRGRWYW